MNEELLVKKAKTLSKKSYRHSFNPLMLGIILGAYNHLFG
jgi:hypothetical protein